IGTLCAKSRPCAPTPIWRTGWSIIKQSQLFLTCPTVYLPLVPTRRVRTRPPNKRAFPFLHGKAPGGLFAGDADGQLSCCFFLGFTSFGAAMGSLSDGRTRVKSRKTGWPGTMGNAF